MSKRKFTAMIILLVIFIISGIYEGNKIYKIVYSEEKMSINPDTLTTTLLDTVKFSKLMLKGDYYVSHPLLPPKLESPKPSLIIHAEYYKYIFVIARNGDTIALHNDTSSTVFRFKHKRR